MTTAATSLLGLALPVTGELSGTWGDTVNNSITSLLDSAIAGTTTLSTDADVTLTTTTLASNQARQAVLLFSGARTAQRTVTAPAQSKIYTVINATTGGFAVKLVGAGPTTGLTIPAGASAVVAWNGSDFIEIGATTLNSLTVSGNLTVAGTTTLSGGTANGIAYLNGSKVLTTGSALVFDGANLGVGVTPSAWASSKAIQIGSSGAPYMGLAQMTTATADGYMLWGAYLTGNRTFAYTTTGDAVSAYRQTANTHAWLIAPSGTAGSAITFTQAMTLDASGNLLVGTTNSSESSGVGFKVKNPTTDPIVAVVTTSSTSAASTYNYYSSGAGAFRFYVDGSGTVHATSIVISAISDERLKENIRDIDTGLNTVMALKPRRYDWKEGKGLDKKNAAGFIAQEFEAVFPECIGTSKAGEDGIEYKNINYETLIPTLVKAIQEQQAIIETLKADVAALKAAQ